MNEIEQNTFRTKNLNLASYLLLTGEVKLIYLDKSNPEEIWFVFGDQKLCEELEKQYWSDQAVVNPKKLFQAQNELKDQMFN